MDLDAGKATIRASRGRVGSDILTDTPKSGRIPVIDLDPGLVRYFATCSNSRVNAAES